MEKQWNSSTIKYELTFLKIKNETLYAHLNSFSDRLPLTQHNGNISLIGKQSSSSVVYNISKAMCRDGAIEPGYA